MFEEVIEVRMSHDGLEQNVRATRPTKNEIMDRSIRWVYQTEEYHDGSPLREINWTRRSLMPPDRLGSYAVTTDSSLHRWGLDRSDE